MYFNNFSNCPDIHLRELNHMSVLSKHKDLKLWIKEYMLQIDANGLKQKKQNWDKQYYSIDRGLECLNAFTPNEKSIVDSLISRLAIKYNGNSCILSTGTVGDIRLLQSLWKIAYHKEYYKTNQRLVDHVDWMIDVTSAKCGGKSQRCIAMVMVDCAVNTASKPNQFVTKKFIKFVNDVLDMKWERPIL